jgi:SAM-dependent methyltransferase
MESQQSDTPDGREPDPAPFDRSFWDERWSEVLRDHADVVAGRPPNEYLTTTASSLAPGRALDAGCGHGAETLWLAVAGWEVTAVDFSAPALAHGHSTAAALGADVAARITWVEGDLGTWTPSVGHFDLVCSLYVHVAGSVEAMVTRLASGVAPGGTLLLVGHLPVDPTTGAETPAAGQAQVTVDAALAALAALDSSGWEMVIAEDRPRAVAGSGFDAVLCARRRS